MKMYNVKVNGVLFKHTDHAQWDRMDFYNNPVGKVWKGKKWHAEKLIMLMGDKRWHGKKETPANADIKLIEVVPVG